MSGGEGFALGFVVATIVWFVELRRQDARINRDIEARLLALDKELVRRIFDARKVKDYGDVDRAARAPEWTAGTAPALDAACPAQPVQIPPAPAQAGAASAPDTQGVREAP
jgi:hypothetical protein